LEDTFVTPLDREDIFALSRAIDNFIDYVYDTVAELEIFELNPSDSMKKIAEFLLEMANELHLATQRLIDHPRVANEHARRIKSIENQVETTCRHSPVDFTSAKSQPQRTELLSRCLVTPEMVYCTQGDLEWL